MDLYHALNRGVEKRNIFLDSSDYVRFVHNLYEFNDTRPAANTKRTRASQTSTLELPDLTSQRDRLVDIHAWCLMRNHYHLLLSERAENGISKFLMKVNVGYAKYFNEKYKRSGYLFQGRTKRILIDNDRHFNYILHYIHLNPLDYLKGAEKWRLRSKGSVQNLQKTLTHLEEYRWSSYNDYVGKNNFPSLLNTGFSFKDYGKEIVHYLKTTGPNLQAVTLE